MGANLDKYPYLKTKEDCRNRILEKQAEIASLKEKIARGGGFMGKDACRRDIARLKTEIAEIKVKMAKL